MFEILSGIIFARENNIAFQDINPLNIVYWIKGL